MSQIRYAIIELSSEPHPVVDVLSIETDPEHEDYVEHHVVEGFTAVESEDAEPGWTWTEEGGLKAP